MLNQSIVSFEGERGEVETFGKISVKSGRVSRPAVMPTWSSAGSSFGNNLVNDPFLLSFPDHTEGGCGFTEILRSPSPL